MDLEFQVNRQVQTLDETQIRIDLGAAVQPVTGVLALSMPAPDVIRGHWRKKGGPGSRPGRHGRRFG